MNFFPAVVVTKIERYKNFVFFLIFNSVDFFIQKLWKILSG